MVTGLLGIECNKGDYRFVIPEVPERFVRVILNLFEYKTIQFIRNSMAVFLSISAWNFGVGGRSVSKYVGLISSEATLSLGQI